MRQVARFWLLIFSFTAGCLAFGYLFLSFASFVAPDLSLVTTARNDRLLAIALALVSLGVFIWAFAFAGTPEPESPPGAGEDDDSGPTLGNRNR